MLSLDDKRWSELKHAYGNASDIPGLLEQLLTLPESGAEKEPWFSLWSALAHQGDVYPASFAAVPHVVRALEKNPSVADQSFFHFPTWIEICRQKSGAVVPDELAPAYFNALGELPHLVSLTFNRDWEEGFSRVALAAIAVAKGHSTLAEIILDLDSETSADFIEWLSAR